jgi:hypothetical protein
VTTELASFLNSKVAEYNQPSFIKDDPVLIPHLFTKKQDIEIAGFFAAVAHESAQVQPHVLRVQRQGPPGPALIEQFEASTTGSAGAVTEAIQPVPDQSSELGEAVSDVCRPAAQPVPVTPEAMLCALGNQAAPILAQLLAGLDDSG